MPLDTRGIDIYQFTQDVFGGGLNLRDSQSKLDQSESPSAWNATIDDRGGAVKRLGYSKWNTAGQPAARIQAGYYSRLLGKTVWQAADKLYSQSGTGSFGAAVHTFTTDARCALVDFAGYIYAVHPDDGVVRSADGTTWAAVSSSPVGLAIAVWQNKLWVLDEDGLLSFCASGDGNNWTTEDSGDNQLRAVNDDAGTALYASELEGLIAYKSRSTYRVYDSFTGAYQTLSAKYGAAGPQAVTSCLGRVFSLCESGIYATDGMTPLGPMSERVRPLFTSARANFEEAGRWCAGTWQDKVYFSLTSQNATENDIALEMHAIHGWVMPHSCAASVYVTYQENDDLLLGAAPSVNGQAWHLYDAVGSDDGEDIESWFQTGWFRPHRLHACSLHQLRIRGRGNFDLYVKRNQTSGPGDLFEVDLRGSAPTWDDGFNWDDGELWGPSAFEGDDVIYSLGYGRDYSFMIRETSSSVASGQQLLETGTSPTIGYWALYALTADYTPLGLS
jgi:hypothetical protein